MNKSQWKRKIKEQMEKAGTYQKIFEPTIETLADILEQRDIAYDDFIQNGGDMVVKNVSDRGAVNLRKNPRLQVWCDLNTQALSFWKELGLTTAGLKRINEMAMKNERKKSALEEALEKFRPA